MNFHPIKAGASEQPPLTGHQPCVAEAARRANPIPSADPSKMHPCVLVGDGGAAVSDKNAVAPYSLPAWADNDEARALIAQIIADRPETRSYDNGCSKWGGWEFKGKAANQLRRIYHRQLQDICDQERALFEAGEPYGAVHDQLSAMMSDERPDALMARVLA